MDYSIGIPDAIYLDGQTLTYPPQAVKPAREFDGSHERLADLTLASDYAAPFVDCEALVRKLGYAFDWNQILGADKRTFARIEANPEAVSLCVWDPIVERFIADGVRATFTISRRIAIDTITPAGGTARYSTEVRLDNVLKTITTHYTKSSPDTYGHVTFTMLSVPTIGQIVEVHYVPLIYVKHTSAPIGFGLPHTESRSFVFIEVM